MMKRIFSALILFLSIGSSVVATVKDSGTFGRNGDNVTWSFTDDGKLTIEGTGEMGIYIDYPWGSYQGEIKTVDIKFGVTNIGVGAFYDCSSLTSVIIPNSVISIGDGSFKGCYSLSSIAMSDNVKYIGDDAFKGCCSLFSIAIPNSVVSIGADAFGGCYMMSSNIQNKSHHALSDYGLTVCDKEQEDGLMIKNNIVVFCRTWSKSAIIPNGVAGIEDEAFHTCSSLSSITIPASVKSIGERAFCNCSSLSFITIPKSVTNIGEGTFAGCYSLSSITIPNSVRSIGHHAFYNCYSLSSIVIPDSVTNIGQYAFNGCFSLSSVTNLSLKPQIISEGTFTNYGVLHVLPGCRSAYESAEYWKNFLIVEDVK